MEELKYPIGKFSASENYTPQEIASFIARIEALPEKLETAIHGLTNAQLDTPYRDGGWTIRQVVHHVADSHMHAYIRTKWTLTETEPIIKAYLEKLWAETPEVTAHPSISINLLRALHIKWTTLLKSLTSQDLKKFFTHPETKRQVRLEVQIAMYAWHGEHHLAHITNLKLKSGW
jgi:hypothetical protein